MIEIGLLVSALSCFIIADIREIQVIVKERNIRANNVV